MAIQLARRAQPGIPKHQASSKRTTEGKWLYFNPIGTWALSGPRRSWELDAFEELECAEARGFALNPRAQNRLTGHYLKILSWSSSKVFRSLVALLWSLLAVGRGLYAFRKYDAMVVLSPTAAALLGMLRQLGAVKLPPVFVIQFHSRSLIHNRTFLGMLKRWAHRGVSAFIVVSEAQAQDLQQILEKDGRTPAQVQTLSSGIDTDYWHPAASKSLLVPRVPYVICSGGAERDEDLVIQLAKAGRIHVVRTGGGPGTARRYQSELVNSPGLSKWLTYYEHVSNQEMRELYTWATATILPIKNVSEPCGQTVMFEALSCGSRVITNHSYTYGGLADELRPHVRLCDRGFEAFLDEVSALKPSGDSKAQVELMRRHHSLHGRNLRLNHLVAQYLGTES